MIYFRPNSPPSMFFVAVCEALISPIFWLPANFSHQIPSTNHISSPLPQWVPLVLVFVNPCRPCPPYAGVTPHHCILVLAVVRSLGIPACLPSLLPISWGYVLDTRPFTTMSNQNGMRLKMCNYHLLQVNEHSVPSMGQGLEQNTGVAKDASPVDRIETSVLLT